jgi:hypothetical protein
VEDSWAKANDEITRRIVIAPVHSIDFFKVERAQPVLLDIRLAYLPWNGEPAISNFIRLSQANLLRQPVPMWSGFGCNILPLILGTLGEAALLAKPIALFAILSALSKSAGAVASGAPSTTP